MTQDWIVHNPESGKSPVPPDSLVEYRLWGEQIQREGFAGGLFWGVLPDFPPEAPLGSIELYRVIGRAKVAPGPTPRAAPECHCEPDQCLATPAGKAVGRLSAESDARCKKGVPPPRPAPDQASRIADTVRAAVGAFNELSGTTKLAEADARLFLLTLALAGERVGRSSIAEITQALVAYSATRRS